MIKAIKFVGVPVRDQQRALDFYTTKIRIPVITDQPFDDDQRWIELALDAPRRVSLCSRHEARRIGSARIPVSLSSQRT